MMNWINSYHFMSCFEVYFLYLSDSNECESNPCQNGGTCTEVGADYQCRCRPGWTGDECTFGFDNPCASDPCFNGATCILQNANTVFICECTPGWAGTLCQGFESPCASNPCQNGAECRHVIHDTYEEYQCDCPILYSGTNCQYRKLAWTIDWVVCS